MDIVYSIDNNFIPQAAALTASIMHNTKSSGASEGSGSFVFHILSNGITEENQRKFREFTQQLGAKAQFYDLGDFEGKLEKLLGAKPETGRFVKAALGRIFIPEYLPDGVRKYLYLDADMIARGDIAPLFSLPLEGKILAAVAEPTIYEGLAVEQSDTADTAEQFGAEGTGTLRHFSENGAGYLSPLRQTPVFQKAYFNTGALLVNRDAWERNDTTKKCLSWYAEKNGTFRFADQDILNNVLAGQILPLDQGWNFQTNYHYQNYASLVKRSPWFQALQSEADYEAARKSPVIVHYAGDERPWMRGNHNPYRADFEKALGLTPWKDMPKQKGKDAYMQVYHLMNLLSAALPGFRAVISKLYYHEINQGKKKGER